MKIEETLSVGCRIESDGQHGTVRFIGEVPPTPGEWLGVEWDDPTRGKHDGSHNGVRYFQTKYPKSGSFLRRKKANTGISFMEALHDRYGAIEDEDAGVIQEEMYVVGARNKTTVVEVVGAKSVNRKQSKLSELRELAFRKMSMNAQTNSKELKDLLPNVRLLDVSNNLISSWESLAQIAICLPKLQELNVGTNRLELPENTERHRPAFQAVRTLMLNRMDYDWSQVCKCSELFTQLEVLHACINQISSITCLTPSLRHLNLLNLESNPIKDWKYILQLGELPKLEMLILNDCDLSQIEFPDVPYGQKTKYFQQLKILHLKNNKISEWSSLNELSKLALLENLIFMRNPLNEPTLKMPEVTIRSINIAKLGNLKQLNRSEISGEERKGSELDYLKMFGKAWKEAGGDQDPAKNNPSAEFSKQHPRYQFLVDKYGPPEDSELKEISSALKNNMIEVKMRCPDVPDKKEISKKVPLSLTVQRLKGLASKLFRAHLATMTLHYSSPQMPGQEFELDIDTKDIGFYAIDQGDTVLVRW